MEEADEMRRRRSWWRRRGSKEGERYKEGEEEEDVANNGPQSDRLVQLSIGTACGQEVALAAAGWGRPDMPTERPPWCLQVLDGGHQGVAQLVHIAGGVLRARRTSIASQGCWNIILLIGTSSCGLPAYPNTAHDFTSSQRLQSVCARARAPTITRIRCQPIGPRKRASSRAAW